MRNRKAPRQGKLPLKFWGGARRNAGRKPKGERAGVSHLRRPEVSGREPLHVGLRLVRGLPDLQRRLWFRVVVEAFERAAERRDDFRVTHYAVQGNHLHLIVEAEDRAALSRGMQGLTIRIARAINRKAKRSGRVFADRFWSRLLATPREVRQAIAPVLGNSRKHAERMGLWITLPPRDPCAAGPGTDAPGIRAPRTWLLRVGWTRAPAPRGPPAWGGDRRATPTRCGRAGAVHGWIARARFLPHAGGAPRERGACRCGSAPAPAAPGRLHRLEHDVAASKWRRRSTTSR